MAAHLAHDHVRYHVVGLGLGERRTRPRIEAGDQQAHGADAGVVGVQKALQLDEIAGGEERQVAVDHHQRIGAERRRLGPRLDLQRKALGRIARAYASGLEALQVLERDAKLLGLQTRFGREQLGDLLEWRGEIAVIVERIDQRSDEQPVAIRDVHDGELRQQVIAQGARRDLLRIEAVVVLVGAAAHRRPNRRHPRSSPRNRDGPRHRTARLARHGRCARPAIRCGSRWRPETAPARVTSARRRRPRRRPSRAAGFPAACAPPRR